MVIEEGRKREKRKVERLEISAGTPKDKKVDIHDGSGSKLGEISRSE